MDISMVLKIAGTGFLVAVINQILSKSGKDEYAMFVTVSGIVVVMLVLVREVSGLFETIRSLFGI
ncbi:MAG: stage III sporulation protein AC [Clostridia bacterium]|nr:stage III sporulation protein AC [Clostridia bacterium]